MAVLNSIVLGALRTFEVAARCGSFTRAAAEIHLTTGAVSQQIKQLEDQLSLSLFKRHSRGIELTPEGSELYEVVAQSLHDISSTVVKLQHARLTEGAIRLKLTPSFAFKWLVPRLQRFYEEYPEIRIQTFAEGALVDAGYLDYDLAIDYGRRPYHLPHAELLIEEKFIPVMTPEYAQKYDWSIPDCWEKAVLLHDAMPWPDVKPDCEWRYWFEQHGMKGIDSNRGHFFNRTDMAMAAAGAGLGVALARLALVEEDFQRGLLMSPFEPIDAGSGYFLLQTTTSDAIDCFKSWLNGEIQQL